MDSMTLREAARRTARSVTTLRRYIRSGQLVAAKRRGRFGPEFVLSESALAEAGLDCSAADLRGELIQRGHGAPSAEETVPVSLFQELWMKHEQLLVQYGMVRVGGMRVLELRSELEAKQRELADSAACIKELRRRFRNETTRLQQLLRRVELEQEGRGLEVAALREKVRVLERLTQNSVTHESIEKQFGAVMEQMRRVDRLTTELPPAPEREGTGPGPAPPPDRPDH